MKIGNTVTGKVFLAPVAGVSDAAFRLICREMGADLTYTEMISAKALCFGDKKTYELLETHSEARPRAVQLFGSDADIMAEAAKKVQGDFDIIDINMGCPAPKIVKNGEGSALMKNPLLAGKIVEKVKRAVNVPVTVKIRRGFEKENCAEVARILEESGADAVCVHGRFTKQMYSGESCRDAVKRVVDSLKIPVIGNGDIFCAEDAASLMKETGCQAVMVARGAFGNPFIFREIKELFQNGKTERKTSDREKIETAIRHIRMITQFRGERIGILNARKHAAWYLKGIKGSAELKRNIYTANTLTEMENILKSVL